jgi:uncharacterized repeat protein (TIGR02543 family)
VGTFKLRRTVISTRLYGAAFMVLSGLIGYAAIAPQTANAGSGQMGTAQVTLNPGGGVMANGTDGLRFTINADSNDYDEDYDSVNDGQDGVVYRSTYQYCCSAGGPMLNIGGELYGQAGPAMGSEDWSSIEIISTSGAASVGTRTANTGNSSATIRYTVVKGENTYTIDRTVSYLYPNDFVTDSYSFVIPAGNSDVVKFYLGGDTAPGSSDQGYGIMLTQPVRSVISLNTSSQIMFGFREVQGSRAFDGATSQNFYAPYGTVEDGGNIGFVGTASNHDAGLMMQWNLGSTPGTYTGKFEQFVTSQGTNLNAVFAQPRADVNVGVNLNISIVNSELENVGGLGYTMTLPTGVTIDGVATSNCGGTLSAVNGASTITISGVTVNAANNCVVSVPVSASTPGSYTVTSSNASGITGALVNNIGVSKLNVAVYILSYATQGGNSINDGAYELGNSATLPTSIRAGYTFMGWNTLANGSGTEYAAGASLVMPAYDLTLYARWQAIPYTVTFNTQGGSSVATLTNQTIGNEIELTESTRTGYEFKHWNTAANDSGTSYDSGDIFTVPAANSTLYAIWAKEVTLTYDTQGGDNVSPETSLVGDEITLSDAPTREGYTFVEWNTEADGSGTGYDEEDDLTLPQDNLTIFAIWEDSDGLTLVTENAAPNGGDANDDGVLDSQQAGVSSFVSTETNKPVSLEITSADECFLSGVTVKGSDELTKDPAYSYPLGLLDFVVDCGSNGFTATVTQFFYDAPINSFVLRKFVHGQYATVSGATFDMQTISGRQVLVVTYDVTDGGPLDADGLVNGIIVDPAGPATLNSVTNNSNNPVALGAPNTGVKPQSANLFIVLGGIGTTTVGLALAIAIRQRFKRG